MQKQYACVHCNAEFKIKHTLESDYYKIEFCPFCGDKLTEDVEDEIDDEDTY